MAEFTYQQRVVIKRGFYAGRKGTVKSELDKTEENRSYNVIIDLTGEAPKTIQVYAIDMRPLKWYEF